MPHLRSEQNRVEPRDSTHLHLTPMHRAPHVPNRLGRKKCTLAKPSGTTYNKETADSNLAQCLAEDRDGNCGVCKLLSVATGWAETMFATPLLWPPVARNQGGCSVTPGSGVALLVLQGCRR
eukprot:335873-Alexandrium_andersonii.AAC.1